MNAEARLTARLLHSVKSIDWLSTGLTLVALFTPHRWIAILGIIEKYVSYRVAFDAKIFDDVANGRMTIEEFDEAAVALKLMPAKKTGRAMIDRCRGAKRLVVIAAGITLAQAIALIALSS